MRHFEDSFERAPEVGVRIEKPKAVVRGKWKFGAEKAVFYVEYEYKGERYITGTVIRGKGEAAEKSKGWYFGKGEEGFKEANRIALLSDKEFSTAEDDLKYVWSLKLKELKIKNKNSS